MNRVFALLLLGLYAFIANAQDPVNQDQVYGNVDVADLQMTSCDFEKDANAEVLFDKALIKFEYGLSMERHIRIKIFNDAGKKSANVRLIYQTEFLGLRGIGDLKAETINLEDNKPVFTPVEKPQIYIEKLNKNFSAFVFSFPNVKAGSIIEYKFKTYPQREWLFQGRLPTRYSEVKVHLPNNNFLISPTVETFVRQPVVTDSLGGKGRDHYWGMSNVHSLSEEPYMTAWQNNLQRVVFSFSGFISTSWGDITNELIKDNGFGGKLDATLPGEDNILKKLEIYETEDEKIAYLFDTVKNRMRWNNNTFLISADGLQTAWKNKTGNSADINLILLHFLKVAGISATPMVVCTRDYGRLAPERPDPFSLNNTVVYIPIDTVNYYLMDASDRYSLYNVIPYNILNSFGLAIDLDTKKYKITQIINSAPIIQSTFINAEISANGKMNGTAEITSDSYNKIKTVKKYNAIGERNYIDSTFQDNNNIHIMSFKMENALVDSLPLTQKFSCTIDLPGSDNDYIYFNTNLFSLTGDNPFKKEQRFSDINLGYRDNYSINGVYKLPAGYQPVSLPKNTTIIMPDQSIVFKRTIAEEQGVISARYVINHKKTIYFMEDYKDLFGFYKKMYELLNEQIVLKKAG